MIRLLFSLLALSLLLPGWAEASESLAERRLRQLVDEERRILNGSRRADGTYDEEVLERRYQGLVHKFDAFIHENPEMAAGFVAFARVLERIGREDAAYALYLKANRIDPNIPLVKNQLGNFLAEKGEFAQALAYYLAAVELAPREAVYHYQIGNLLHHFRDEFVAENVFQRDVLDSRMLEAFREAARLAPAEMAFAYRFAETFYDLETPRWDEALREWRKLENKATSSVERETLWLHQANVLEKMGQADEARQLLDRVQSPVLARNKENVLARLGPPVPPPSDDAEGKTTP